MKKQNGFTLIEILISISIFSIVILFLHKTLDMTQKSNAFYSEKLEDKKEQNNLKKMFFLDLIQKKSSLFKSIEDKEKNSIVKFKTTNTYRNPFFQNITYMVSKEKNLLRIESKDEFDTKKLNDAFFKNSYIDIVDNNITKFKVKKQKDKVLFYILKENQKILYSF